MSGVRVHDEPFAVVPEWILDADISDRAFRVWSALSRFASTDGRAFPSRAVLAARCRTSLSSLDRALGELESIGALRVVGRRNDTTGAQVASDYYLIRGAPTTSEDAEITPDPLVTGDFPGGRTPDDPPSSPLNRPLVTGDDPPSSPVTHQEERKPVERKPENESARETSSSTTSTRAPTAENDDDDPDPRITQAAHYHAELRLDLRRQAETAGKPLTPIGDTGRWLANVAQRWTDQHAERALELLTAWPNTAADELVALVDEYALPAAARPPIARTRAGCTTCDGLVWITDTDGDIATDSAGAPRRCPDCCPPQASAA